MKKKTGAFKHREYNSQALVMISNILKREEEKEISFTFGVKEREQLYNPKSPLELSVLFGAHVLSMCRQTCPESSLGCGLDFVCNMESIALSSEHKDRTCLCSTKFIRL